MVKCHKRYLQLVGSESEAVDHSKRVSWSAEEDEILRKQVAIYGTKNWMKVSEALPNRIHKQCRERWINVLSPRLTKLRWTDEEDRQIMHLYHELGPRWT